LLKIDLQGGFFEGELTQGSNFWGGDVLSACEAPQPSYPYPLQQNFKE